MSPRCPFCRAQTCDPCPRRLAQERALLETWRLRDARVYEPWRDDEGDVYDRPEPPSGQPLLVWFLGSEPEQRQNLNRLQAEWPYALEVIEPTEPGDSWGARLARDPRSLGRDPIELEVTAGRVQRVSDAFLRAIERSLDGPQGLGDNEATR